MRTDGHKGRRNQDDVDHFIVRIKSARLNLPSEAAQGGLISKQRGEITHDKANFHERNGSCSQSEAVEGQVGGVKAVSEIRRETYRKHQL